MSPASIMVLAILGLLCAAIFLVLISRSVAILRAGRRQAKDEFDERQLRVRADAYRIGFMCMLGSVLAMMVLFSWQPWVDRVDTMVTLVGTVMIAFLVFAIYCITHDAFLRRNERASSYLTLSIAAMLCNLAVVIRDLVEKGTLFVDGKATMTPFGNAMMAGVFFVVSIVLVIKIIVNRKEEDDDEES